MISDYLPDKSESFEFDDFIAHVTDAIGALRLPAERAATTAGETRGPRDTGRGRRAGRPVG